MAKPLKLFVKTKMPALFEFWRRMKRPVSERPAEQTFTRKFHKHASSDMTSLSGPGSDLAQTDAIRAALPELLRELQVRTLLDVPCGDFYWMKLVKLDVDYIGGDIVAGLVERNRRAFGNGMRRFVQLDIRGDALPDADLLLCRDCLVHLSNADVLRALANIERARCTYLLTTTFVARDANDDIPTGKWRPLNLEKPPFSLPTPLRVIDERHPSAEFRDKRLGLWRVDDVRSALSIPRSQSRAP